MLILYRTMKNSVELSRKSNENLYISRNNHAYLLYSSVNIILKKSYIIER